jgi:hypothetical protein
LALLTILNTYLLRLLDRFSDGKQWLAVPNNQASEAQANGREQLANASTSDIENEQRTLARLHGPSWDRDPRHLHDDGAQSLEAGTLQEKHAHLTATIAEKQMREEIEGME